MINKQQSYIDLFILTFEWWIKFTLGEHETNTFNFIY